MNSENKLSFTRRNFLKFTIGASITMPMLCFAKIEKAEEKIELNGPATKYIPRINAAFVRRKEDYGILWPGAIYDGKRAMDKYKDEIFKAEKDIGVKINLRSQPIYSLEEAEEWINESKNNGVDGLLLVLLDRQKHSWQSASKTASSGIPTVVFSPIGTSFTTNTAPVAEQNGVYIVSSDDFSDAKFGLKMLKAGAKLRKMRFVVIKGNQRIDKELPHFGTNLHQIPAREFIEIYNGLVVTPEIEKMATDYIRSARKIISTTRPDVINGLKSYLVARQIISKEEGDGITMDCLGALGPTKISLPCIAWSKMNDVGIPAACEADIGAAITLTLVHYLFDRPGFQQDPVPETTKGCLIGAHCSCPTRLEGYNNKPEPFNLMHHHGNRDAVPRPFWRTGKRVTIADVLTENIGAEKTPSKKPQMYISTGTVVDNISVPPSGGCVVSVMVKLDTEPDLLKYPGFHQIFFYGDFKNQLVGFCRLFNIEPLVV